MRALSCPTLCSHEDCSPPAASVHGGTHSYSLLCLFHIRGLGDPSGPAPPWQLGPKTVNSREHASQCKPANPEPPAHASSTGAHPLGHRPPARPPWAGSMRLGWALRPKPAATIQTQPCSDLMGEQTSGHAHQTGKPVTHMDQLSQVGPWPPGEAVPEGLTARACLPTALPAAGETSSPPKGELGVTHHSPIRLASQMTHQ